MARTSAPEATSPAADVPAGARTPEDWQAYWLAEIERYSRTMEAWHSRCKTVVGRYRQGAKAADTHERRYALLWANVETLKPAVYARPPQAVVGRRNRKANPVARQASEVLESATNYALGASDIDGTLQRVRDDYLLTARGTAWVRYEYDEEMMPVPVGLDAMGQPIMGEAPQITDERAAIDYVHRDDFAHDPARIWKEVGWVARRAFLTDERGKARFGEAWKDVSLDHRRDDEKDVPDPEAKATVWEIWSRTDNMVFWIAKGGDTPLDMQPPPFSFDGFFPCPEPVYGTLSSDDLIPTPDYMFWQEQDNNLDRLTRRIDALTGALKVVGFVPTMTGDDGFSAIANAIESGAENRLIPVPSWAAFTEKGGSGAIQWWPVEQVVKVLKGCYEARQLLIAEVYEITGISDIIRGSTDPNETATAQGIKAQWGSIRVRDRQAALARFARDMCRLAAEIMAEAFQPQTLARMTEIEFGPEVMELLRDGVARNFVIDVETDSTVQPDENAEKQRRVEFGTAFAGLLGQAQQSLGVMPPPMAAIMAPVIGQGLLFMIRGFRVGREMEETVEQAVEQLVAMFQQAAQAPPQPDPAQMAAQIKAEAEGKRAEADQAIVATEIQGKREEQAMARESHAMDLQKMAAEAASRMAQAQAPREMAQ